MSIIGIFLGIGLCVGAIARMTLCILAELAHIRDLEDELRGVRLP